MSRMENQHDNLSLGLVQHILLDHKNGQNLFLSAYSIRTILSILARATRANTRQQIVDALSSINNLHSIHFNQSVIQEANLIYCPHDCHLDEQFLQEVAKNNKVVAKNVNFKSNKQAELVNLINEDVNRLTNGTIRQVVDEVDASNSILLVNAIHFKDSWKCAFNADHSYEWPFNLTNGEQVPVWMMSRKGNDLLYYYWQPLNLDCVLMHYQTDKLAMLVLLPDADHNLNQLVNELNWTTFRAICSGLKSNQMEFALPRFRINSGAINLVGCLQSFNIRSIFDPAEADLSAMITTNRSDLHVSAMWQKATIELNEEGTECSSGTVCQASRVQRSCPVHSVICDRPFLFFILQHNHHAEDAHQSNPIILFSGVVQDPTK